MHTKILYTLVSDNNDTYFEQLLVSIYSVRIYHPDAIVEVLTDNQCYSTLTDTRAVIFQYATNVKAVTSPNEYGKMQRSRYLKTNLRRLVDGDYLFIDCDTIVCGSLDKIDEFDGDIAMVADINGQLALCDQMVIEKCTKAGFANVKGKPYFNSGVIYAKDTPAAHQLYSEWYKLWKVSDARGVSYDQPALCQANTNLGYPIKELSGVWNCQFKFNTGYQYLNKALILHYYSNNGKCSNYSQERIFEYVKEKGRIDSVVEKLICNPKTIFYTAVTISPDKAFEFFNSELLYYYFNFPPVYRLTVKLARHMKSPFHILFNIKTLFKKSI